MLLFSITLCFAQHQTLNSRILRDSTELAQIKNEFSLLKASVEQNNTLVANGHSTIANELSTATTSIGVFSIILTIILVIAGVLLSRMESSTRKVSEETREKLSEIRAIEISITKIQEEITGNISKLYRDLQREELDDTISKIENYPNLAKDLLGKLAVFPFNSGDFPRLLKVFKTNTQAGFGSPFAKAFISFLYYRFPKESLSSDYYFPIPAPNEWLLKSDIELIDNFILENSGKQDLPVIRQHLIHKVWTTSGAMRLNFLKKLTIDEIKQMLLSTEPHFNGEAVKAELRSYLSGNSSS